MTPYSILLPILAFSVGLDYIARQSWKQHDCCILERDKRADIRITNVGAWQSMGLADTGGCSSIATTVPGKASSRLATQSTSVGNSPKVTYDTWNEALATHFFRPEYRGRPVFLQVDTGTLRLIGRGLGVNEEDAEQSFIRALRGQLAVTSNTPFSPLEPRIASWRRSHDRKSKTPPFLAVLGLCVLAASRMHAESATRMGAGTYYGRLNEILGRQDRKAPDDFQKTEGYWSLLGEWLNGDNRKERGVFRSQKINHLTFIGHALSQCLLREVDKEHLRKFFQDVNMGPRLAEDPKALLPKLIRWYETNPNGLSVLARRLLREGDADIRMLMAEAVAAEARQSTRPMAVNIDAARRADLALRIDVERGGRQFELQFFPPPRRSRFAEGAFSSHLGTFELVALDIESWCQPIPLDPEIVFNRGIELRRDDFLIEWQARKVLAAVHNLELGGYVSPCRVDPRRSVLVLCHESMQPKLEQYLADHAEPGWRRAHGRAGLPTSWHAYLDVVLSSVAKIADPDLECLVPSREARPILEGGLRVAENTWLVGAEPTFRHTAAEPGHVAIYVDDKLVLQTSDGLATIHLADLQLSPGNHEVCISDQVRRTTSVPVQGFTTVLSGDYKPSRTPSRKRMLGHDLAYDNRTFRATYPSPRPLGPDGRPHPGVRIEGARIEADPGIGLGPPATEAPPPPDESNITWTAPRLL